MDITSRNRSQSIRLGGDIRLTDVVENVATVGIAVTRTVPDVVTGVGMAVSIAEKIIEITQQVSHNKRRCHFLVTRIKVVLDVLSSKKEPLAGVAMEDQAGVQLQSLIRYSPTVS
jgi:hypothetical protein